MGIGRDVLGIGHTRAVLVDADGGAVRFVGVRLVLLRIARIALPEIGAFEEFEAGRGQVDRFQAVDEAEQLGP